MSASALLCAVMLTAWNQELALWDEPTGSQTEITGSDAEPTKPSAEPSKKRLELGFVVGPSWLQRSTGDGFELGAHFGLTGAWSPAQIIGMPLRLEAMLATNSHGPPWGRGVEAVEVARLDLDLAALGGVAWPFYSRRGRVLGLEALVGPRLRLTRVSARVRSSFEASCAAALHLQLAAGTFVAIGRFRIGLRAALALPWDQAVQLLVQAGVGL